MQLSDEEIDLLVKLSRRANPNLGSRVENGWMSLYTIQNTACCFICNKIFNLHPDSYMELVRNHGREHLQKSNLLALL